MSFMTRRARAASLAAAAALFAAAMPVCHADAAAKKQAGQQDQPGGQAAGDEQAAKKAATEAAKRAYDNGIKSFQAGKYQPAVDQLSAALRGGGLASSDMARGLYYRGLAYKKQNKPGLAISDLTSALWLKNGLSDAERQSATNERAEAYKAAGLGDGNSGADTVAASDPKTESAAVPAKSAGQAPSDTSAAASGSAAPAPTQAPQSVAASDSGVPQPLTMGAETAVPAPPKVRQVPATNDPAGLQAAVAAPYATSGGVAQGAGSNQAAPFSQPGFDPSTSAPQAVALNAVPSEQSNSPAPATSGSSGGGIGGFFSNLFSPSAKPAAAAPDGAAASGVTTASTTQPSPQTSSWSDQTSLAEGAAKKGKASKVAAATPAAAPAAEGKATAVKTKSGKFKLHIAAVRSRAEAEALAQKLAQEHGGTLRDRAPAVDEAVIGSMGTFYRVRVGSYATADEPRGLCNTLRNSGYDCLVVSN